MDSRLTVILANKTVVFCYTWWFNLNKLGSEFERDLVVSGQLVVEQ